MTSLMDWLTGSGPVMWPVLAIGALSHGVILWLGWSFRAKPGRARWLAPVCAVTIMAQLALALYAYIGGTTGVLNGYCVLNNTARGLEELMRVVHRLNMRVVLLALGLTVVPALVGLYATGRSLGRRLG